MDTNPIPAAAPIFRGITDMFAWPLRTSHYLELVNPLWTTHALRARVQAVWDDTRDARTLTLRPGRGWRTHRAGQYVRVAVPVDGTHHVRTYSISSPPEREDGCLTITVKAVAGGRVSTHLVRNVAPGAVLSLGLPQGDFVLPEAVPVRPLFITAGSGITPVMSMLRSFALRGSLPDVVHLHYAPHAYDSIFGNELERLAQTYRRYRLHPTYTRDLAGEPARHFSAAQLDAVCPDWRGRDCYACGPQDLLTAVETHWQQAGLAHRLHIERFRAPLAEPPADVAGGRVCFTKSGVAIDADGRTNLLRVAEDAGLNPPHGCRMGICHSCTATLASGCVRDLRTNDLIDEPGARVQVCICAAAGNVQLDL
jgi:ferredoxin-NADP reductase